MPRVERGLKLIAAGVEHTRHRSLANAMVNILAALVAYTHQPCKPSLHLSKNALNIWTGYD